MLVDIHAHFSQQGLNAVPPGRIATYAGVAGVDLALISNRDGAALPPGSPDLEEPEINLACLKACAGHGRLAPLYWVRPGSDDSHVSALAGALASEPFVGAVFAPAANDFDAAATVLDPYLAALVDRRRPAVFCVTEAPPAHPARVGELARRHPDVPFVLCHCDASDALRAASVEVLRGQLQRGESNLHLDTSHASAEWIRSTARAIGFDRLLFGSQAPVYGDAHVPKQIALLHELRTTLATQEFEQITGGNACRLFSLDARKSSKS